VLIPFWHLPAIPFWLVLFLAIPATQNFVTQHIHYSLISENDFYETHAVTDSKCKQCNVNRFVHTRHACHGFHFVLCKSKHFHSKTEESCACEKYEEIIDAYHYLKCRINDNSVHEAAKATEEAK
jgi:hypothetical protein